jgi:hypothetical protein
MVGATGLPSRMLSMWFITTHWTLLGLGNKFVKMMIENGTILLPADS